MIPSRLGGRIMSAPRSSFVPLYLGTIAAALATGAASTAVAQVGGGMGPDPYRPYSSQFDPFIYPVPSNGGQVLPSNAALGRAGLMRANRFQEFLDNSSFGTGNSNYRTQRRLNRDESHVSQYQPNRAVDEKSGFYEKKEYVSQVYFSYLRESDPKKRAELLKKYQQARARPARDFAAADGRDAAAEEGADGGGADESTAAGRAGRRGAGARRSALESPSRVPPSPERESSRSSRTGRPDAPSPLQERRTTAPEAPASSSPAETLEESLRRDRRLRTSPLRRGIVNPRSSRTPSPSPAPPPPPIQRSNSAPPLP